MSDAPENPAHEHPANTVEADRRAKLARLRDEFHIDPYGHRIDGLITLAAARDRYDAQADEAHKADAASDQRPVVKIAGRVMLRREMGNLIFMTLRDATADVQVAISKKSVAPDAFKLAKLTDLSDQIVVAGPLAKTKTGEITVWASGDDGFVIAAKSLAPPPEKWHGLTDPEQRYRKRYVDLYVNPDVMATMQKRIAIIEEMRQFLRSRGFLEVETPMMQPLAGGAAARPFVTHHNALDIPLYLRIAPELYLKRLLVGGFPKVFEINRNFRNEGISPRHNPEFTMLEAYEAFGSWETMADLVEEMVTTVAQKVLGTLIIEHKDADGNVAKTINLTRPWRRVRMVDLVEERTGWKFDKQALSAEQIDQLRASNPGKDLKLDGTPAEQLVEVYEKVIEHTLIDPCFVTHVPSVVIPLAKENRDDPFFADVYELAINGQEISPGYSELNDPDVQERHFRHQVGDKDEQQKVDEDFLEALRVGMPPAGGMGLGIDRLVMMLTGAASIRDVILFPLMRPQG
ncbi:MAG: lysine--tRNA ligase [Planctomycetes bacterium]|nr:lysine--tRNA ligase [Planctomycetota bacterium]